MPSRTTSRATGCTDRGLHVQASTSARVIGTRHERERKRDPADRRRDQRARGRGCTSVSEEELRGQTEKFRGIIRERTRRARGARRRAARSRSARRRIRPSASGIDTELSGVDGRGGVEGELRDAIAEVLDEILPEAFATVREAARRLVGTTVIVTGRELDVEHGAVRRAAHGRHPAAPRQDRRNGDGRRQDARRDAAAVSERAARQGRAPRHGQLLPRPPRLAVDGAPLQLPRPHRRLPRRHRAGDAGAPRRVPGRHHLRHEQRVRLRLPARQHGRRRSSSACSAATSSRSSTKSTRCSSTRRGRRSSSRVRSATRATRSTSSTTPPSRGSCASRRSSSTSLVGEAERELEKGDTHGAALKLYKAQLGQPEEQAAAEAAAGAGQQAARAEDGARAHRRSQAAGRQAAVSATSRRTCSSCSTRRDTRCTSPIAGVDFMSPDEHEAFVLPDSREAVHRIDHDHELTRRAEDRGSGASSRSSTRRRASG